MKPYNNADKTFLDEINGETNKLDKFLIKCNITKDFEFFWFYNKIYLYISNCKG